MADTGAPWNIPYVENADLVKDYPTASLALANAVASGLDAAANAGIGSNVVQAVKTDVFTTTSTSLTDLTGLTGISITPTSATSKILVIASINGATSDTSGAGVSGFSVLRGSTEIYVGTSGTSDNLSGALTARLLASPAVLFNSTAVFLDSPATTSAVTYKIQVVASAGTLYINRNEDTSLGVPSSVTLIEVAG